MSSRPIMYAVRALRRELFSFQFDYPIEIIPDAGSVAEKRERA